jgi:hypothetical protein
MKNFFRKFEARFPTLHLAVVGVGGATLIVSAVNGALWFLGGEELTKNLSVLSIAVGVAWLLPRLLKFRFRMILEERTKNRN